MSNSGLKEVIKVDPIAFRVIPQTDKKDLEKITFVLDWTPNTNHTGLYVAQELGYFEEAGLEVEIVQPPEDGAEVLVASGKAQFGVSFQDSMAPAFAREDALPITAVAAVIQHNTSGIISRKGEGMDTPKGMEGHSYATWNGSIELAPIVGLSEVICDIVETGSTLKENGLNILEEICPLSARMIVNQVSMQMESQRIGTLIQKLRELVKQQ